MEGHLNPESGRFPGVIFSSMKNAVRQRGKGSPETLKKNRFWHGSEQTGLAAAGGSKSQGGELCVFQEGTEWTERGRPEIKFGKARSPRRTGGHPETGAVIIWERFDGRRARMGCAISIYSRTSILLDISLSAC